MMACSSSNTGVLAVWWSWTRRSFRKARGWSQVAIKMEWSELRAQLEMPTLNPTMAPVNLFLLFQRQADQRFRRVVGNSNPTARPSTREAALPAALTEQPCSGMDVEEPPCKQMRVARGTRRRLQDKTSPPERSSPAEGHASGPSSGDIAAGEPVTVEGVQDPDKGTIPIREPIVDEDDDVPAPPEDEPDET